MNCNSMHEFSAQEISKRQNIMHYFESFTQKVGNQEQGGGLVLMTQIMCVIYTQLLYMNLRIKEREVM